MLKKSRIFRLQHLCAFFSSTEMKFLISLHFRKFFSGKHRKRDFNGFLTRFNLADEVLDLKRPKVVFLTKINGTRFESAPFVSAWAPKERLWILFGQSPVDSASFGRWKHQLRITAQFHPFLESLGSFFILNIGFQTFQVEFRSSSFIYGGKYIRKVGL